MHRIYYEVTQIQGHILLSNGIPMSLAQAWICSRKEDTMLKSQKLTKSKYGKTEVIQGSRGSPVFYV